MTRSIWKGPFVDPVMLKKASIRKLWSRRSTILPSFVGKSFEIHNGKSFLLVKVTEQMIGHKFGEFASTRKKPMHKKKAKK
uniref:Small ribosomal subunit protein uS19c n=1 Tax=Nephroselmis olivacea TaxID=31312 RepID=Q9TCA9_NEPOL|nr:ribosomal protein S19 [Nephroselmis olivacea]AAF03188.1 ribosomal protein S19 [Nephroselmis olivacea]